MKEEYQQWAFIETDSVLISELGEELDKYNFEDYPHLAMDIWEHSEHGLLWDLRFEDDEPAEYVPEDSMILHRVADCQRYYSPRDQLLCYFVIAMEQYAKRKETEKCKK